MEDTQRAITFITNMASIHALPLPGRNRTNKDERYLLLPCDITKAFVYRKYKEACEEEQTKAFKRRKFETGRRYYRTLLLLSLQLIFVSPVNRTILLL